MTDFKDFKVGDRVKDSDGMIGEITEIKDVHNVTVDYVGLNGVVPKDNEDWAGRGIYCQDPSCGDLYDPLEKIEK